DTVIPAGTPQQLGRYTYANNSPFTYRDPSGRWSISGAISGAVSAVRDAISSAVSAVREYASSVSSGARASTSPSSGSSGYVNDGNNPGNRNASGYHGGGGSDRPQAGSSSPSVGSSYSTGNYPGNPRAAGYHTQPTTGGGGNLQATPVSCSDSGCTQRAAPFESVTGRVYGPGDARSADSVEDLHGHVADEMRYAYDVYGETALTHEIHRFSFSNHVWDGTDMDWDTTHTIVSHDDVPRGTDVVVIEQDPESGCRCW
ncbi:MAG: hypothetical protein ACKV2T_43845, partial [Kofleriaceae bacterium]